MKKELVLALIAAIGITVTGCGGMSFSYVNPVTGEALDHDDDDDDYDEEDIENEIEETLKNIEDEEDLEELFEEAEKKWDKMHEEEDIDDDEDEDYEEEEDVIEEAPLATTLSDDYYESERMTGEKVQFNYAYIENGILYVEGELQDFNCNKLEDKLYQAPLADSWRFSGMLPAGDRFGNDDVENVNARLGKDAEKKSAFLAFGVENGVVTYIHVTIY